MSGSGQPQEFSWVFDHDRSGQAIAIQGMTLVGDTLAERRDEVAFEVAERLEAAGVVLNLKEVEVLRDNALTQVRAHYLKEVL